MTHNEENFISFIRELGIPILDRRPTSSNPLPFRGDAETGEYAGYREHNFERDCQGICGHHSVSKQKKTSSAEQHAKYHLKRWSSAGGVAYTVVIDPDGTIILCWDFNRRLYSQGWKDVADNPETLGDENIRYKGILIEGNMCGPHNDTGTDEPTPEQMLSLEAVHLAFATLYGMTKVTGHSALGKVACPGATIEGWIKSHNAGVSVTKLSKGLGEKRFDLDTFKGRQRALSYLGHYSGKIDGDFGPKSKAALIVFQSETGLVPDGVFGAKTRVAMIEVLNDAKGR